ncbi:hypothetical protein ACW2QC_18960 [Virgibacillus sp. FSP13]
MDVKPSTTIRRDYNGFSKYQEDRKRLESELLVAERQIDRGSELMEHDQVIERMLRKVSAIN